MSKLIVDDIELASGDLFNVPSSIQTNSSIPISGGQISVGTGLPTSLLKVVTDFSAGQPESSTYTLSTPSNNLFGIQIFFQNFVIYSGGDRDLNYDVLNDTMDDHVLTSSNLQDSLKYSSVGVYSNSATAANYTGYQPTQKGVQMGGARGNYGLDLSGSNYRSRNENWQHYMAFGTNNDGSKHYRKVMFTGRCSGGGDGSVPAYMIQSSTEYYNGNPDVSRAPDPTSPYTKLVFRHNTSQMTISRGRILVMEIPK